MTTDDSKEIVRRFWEEIFGHGDIEAIDEVCAANYRLHNLIYREIHRLSGLKRIVRETHYAVPGLRVVVDDQWLTVDGRVFTRFTLRVSPPQEGGASQQPVPPGGEWEYSGMSTSRVVEGKIEESWLLWEALRAAEELGSAFGEHGWRWPPWK